nr:immunoglobulin light chain junction region [Macaca mulatta]MOW15794.1 immunoglobulin light chain junction region [Macaca mulatta]MOW17345.1 immunoglobulin light chain junction region [Macaca mulatta]MOW18230.1 immunoglobulin light chain junction region [Macaca mulatta]MOW18421.1 immunoglobulin light chain junction region [Macaca mulatta]
DYYCCSYTTRSTWVF